MAIVTVVITVSQPSRTKYDYDLSRDKNYVYVNSHNDRLSSAKLKIIGEDKQSMYCTKTKPTKFPSWLIRGRKDAYGIISKPI